MASHDVAWHRIRYPQFPAWFGKNSSRGKHRRLTADLTMHLATTNRGGCGREALRLDLLEPLRAYVTAPLAPAWNEPSEAVAR